MAAVSALVFSVMALMGRSLPGMLGVQGRVAEFAWHYLIFACMIGAPFTILNLVVAAIVRAEGKTAVASIGMVLGVLVNVILAPLLIFVADLQVAGAALATALSNATGLAFLIVYVIRHREDSMVKLSLRPRAIPGSDVRSIIAIGIPASLVIFLASVSNSAMVRFLSDQPTEVLSGMGVIQRLEMIPFQLIMGISDGVIPLVAYTFASGDRRRMRAAIRMTLGIGLTISLAGLVLYEIFASDLVCLFINDPSVVEYGESFLRLRALAMPSVGGGIHAHSGIPSHWVRSTSHGAVSLAQGHCGYSAHGFGQFHVAAIWLDASTAPPMETVGAITAIILFRTSSRLQMEAHAAALPSAIRQQA